MVGNRNDGKIGKLFASKLVTDLDAGRLGIHGIGHDLIERLLLLDDAQNGTQLAKILELRLIEQVLRTGGGNRRLLGRTRRKGRRNDGAAQVVGDAGLPRGLGDLSSPLPPKRMVGKARIERVGEPRQVVGLDLGAELEQALRRDAQRGNDHATPVCGESQISWMCLKPAPLAGASSRTPGCSRAARASGSCCR